MRRVLTAGLLAATALLAAACGTTTTTHRAAPGAGTRALLDPVGIDAGAGAGFAGSP